MCKAPLPYYVVPTQNATGGGSLFVLPNAGRSAAGADGAGLAPGTCAWEDHALGIDEPRYIRVGWTGTGPGDRLETFERCLHESGCVINFCAQTNARGGPWGQKPGIVMSGTSPLKVIPAR